MDKRIVFTRPDGGVSIVVPAEDDRLIAAVVVGDGNRVGRHVFPAPVRMGRAKHVIRAAEANGLSAEVEWAESEEDFLGRVMAKSVPAGAADVEVVPAEAIPADRSFREIWERDTSPGPEAIKVPLPEARALQLARIRARRNAELEKLDGPQVSAFVRDDKAAAEIEARKQVLRDLPQKLGPEIEAAETPEAIAAIWPEELEAT